MLCMCVLQRGHNGDGCDLALTVCTYDLRKGDLFVPYGRGILQSRSHNCLVGSHECLLLFTASCCSECFYHL